MNVEKVKGVFDEFVKGDSITMKREDIEKMRDRFKKVSDYFYDKYSKENNRIGGDINYGKFQVLESMICALDRAKVK